MSLKKFLEEDYSEEDEDEDEDFDPDADEEDDVNNNSSSNNNNNNEEEEEDDDDDDDDDYVAEIDYEDISNLINSSVDAPLPGGSGAVDYEEPRKASRGRSSSNSDEDEDESDGGEYRPDGNDESGPEESDEEFNNPSKGKQKAVIKKNTVQPIDKKRTRVDDNITHSSSPQTKKANMAKIETDSSDDDDCNNNSTHQ